MLDLLWEWAGQADISCESSASMGGPNPADVLLQLRDRLLGRWKEGKKASVDVAIGYLLASQFPSMQ